MVLIREQVKTVKERKASSVREIEGVKPAITVFHCIKALDGVESLALNNRRDINLKSVKLPCSSMVKDIYLLRAFEAGADAVVVLTCPEGQCQYVDGNIRARKRVERLQKLLDEIGLGGEKLSLFNISRGDINAADQIMEEISSSLTGSDQ